ncbi:hypothetical protein NDU88_006699 [Pleurodeles waltl]|uniref:Uncharacterized protein n=1 Tax=Pleurodeles waltl TaxID=8319 RepID=A0AAV7QLV1_PLEWA|nr:hypothetical protein NDU88_006699 [Pleurodeles waltl]
MDVGWLTSSACSDVFISFVSFPIIGAKSHYLAGPGDARDFLSPTLLDSLGRTPVVLCHRPRSPALLVLDPVLLCRELPCLSVEVRPPLRVVHLEVSVRMRQLMDFPLFPSGINLRWRSGWSPEWSQPRIRSALDGACAVRRCHLRVSRNHDVPPISGRRKRLCAGRLPVRRGRPNYILVGSSSTTPTIPRCP